MFCILCFHLSEDYVKNDFPPVGRYAVDVLYVLVSVYEDVALLNHK